RLPLLRERRRLSGWHGPFRRCLAIAAVIVVVIVIAVAIVSVILLVTAAPDGQRLLHAKREDGLRRYPELAPAGYHLCSGSGSATGQRADCRALAATCDCAHDGAE